MLSSNIKEWKSKASFGFKTIIVFKKLLLFINSKFNIKGNIVY